jgi:hypothetical protein
MREGTRLRHLQEQILKRKGIYEGPMSRRKITGLIECNMKSPNHILSQVLLNINPHDYTVCPLTKDVAVLSMSVFFKFFTDNKVNLYSTLGNHDTYYRQSIQLDGPSQFANSEYIHIVKDCCIETFDNTKIAMVPWICDENKEEVTKWIVDNKNKNTILCGHFELAGFPIQKG